MSEYLTSPTALGKHPITAYGQRSAAFLVARMRRLAPAQRGPVLRSVLDAVDPSLWGRAQAGARAARAAGVPAGAALQRGLASAMSAGVTAELATIGRGGGRRAPAPASLLGLGVWGPAGLGDLFEDLGKTTITQQQADAAARDHRGEGTTGPHTSPPVPAANVQLVQVGPFTFSPGGGGVMIHSSSAIPAAWLSYFRTEIAKLPARTGGEQMTAAQFVGLDKTLGLPPTQKLVARFFDGSTPAFKTKDPVSGKDMGIYLRATVGTLGIQYKEVPAPQRSLFGKLWDAIKDIPSRLIGVGQDVYDAAKDAAGFLADQACQLVNSATGEMMASGAGGATTGIATGGTSTAVAVGAQVVKNLCNGAPPVNPQLPLPVPPPPGGWMIPAAIGGGALLLVLALR